MAKNVEFTIGDTDVRYNAQDQMIYVNDWVMPFNGSGRTESFNVQGPINIDNGEKMVTVPYVAELDDGNISVHPVIQEMEAPVRDKIAVEKDNQTFPDYKILTKDTVKEVQVGDRTITYDAADKQHRLFCDNKELDFKNGAAFIVINGKAHCAELDNDQLNFRRAGLSMDEALAAKNDASIIQPEIQSVPVQFETAKEEISLTGKEADELFTFI